VFNKALQLLGVAKGNYRSDAETVVHSSKISFRKLLELGASGSHL
jgi:hypothetical protein